MLIKRIAAGDGPKAAPDPRQHRKIGQCDQQQEPGGHRRPDDPSHRMQPIPAPRGIPAPLDAACRRGDRNRHQDHHRRMAEREIAADADRPPAVLHQLAHRIVDRGDVVGIDRVAQAEHPGQQGQAKQRGPVRKCGPGPHPGSDIGADQQRIQTPELRSVLHACCLGPDARRLMPGSSPGRAVRSASRTRPACLPRSRPTAAGPEAAD